MGDDDHIVKYIDHLMLQRLEQRSALRAGQQAIQCAIRRVRLLGLSQSMVSLLQATEKC